MTINEQNMVVGEPVRNAVAQACRGKLYEVNLLLRGFCLENGAVRWQIRAEGGRRQQIRLLLKGSIFFCWENFNEQILVMIITEDRDFSFIRRVICFQRK